MSHHQASTKYYETSQICSYLLTQICFPSSRIRNVSLINFTYFDDKSHDLKKQFSARWNYWYTTSATLVPRYEAIYSFSPNLACMSFPETTFWYNFDKTYRKISMNTIYSRYSLNF